MAKLFVSYSRKDSVAARKLIEAFKSINQDVWVDWESIPPAVDWLEQIFRGIEESDAFIFLISPDSVASEVCKVEITRAAQHNKRIVPIVLRDVDPSTTHENIRKLNWTFLRETDNFEEGLAKVKTAIELDLDWLEEHRRLLVRSLEWHRRKDPSLLLRGRDLRNAQRMVATATAKDPIPTELQQAFILHSRRSERNRTIAWIATGTALLIMAFLLNSAIQQSRIANQQRARAENNEQLAKDNAALAVLNEQTAKENEKIAREEEKKAIKSRKEAEQQKRLAEAQRSAARAQIFQTRPGELDTSTLLAIDSWQKSPSDEAEEILRKNISLLPLPIAQASRAGTINALEFSPDGTTFLTASMDGSACIWNLKDGKELFCADSPESMNDAAFSPGGELIVTGNESGIAQLLDATNGAVQNEFEYDSPVQDVNISSDGKLLAVARDDGKITVINLRTNRKISDLQTTGRLKVSAFSPDGVWMAAGSNTGVVTVWNLNDGRSISRPRHKGEVLAISFSPNNRFIATGGQDKTAIVVRTDTGDVVMPVANEDSVQDVAFSPDSSWFVTVSDDRRIRVWDIKTGTERLRMLQNSVISEVKVSSNGQWIATTGPDKTVRLWNAATGAEIFQIPLKASGSVLAFREEGDILLSGDESGAINVWDISTMAAPVKYIQFNGTAGNVQFSPSGHWIVASDENRIWLLNPDSISSLTASPGGAPILTMKSKVKDVIFSPDSNLLGILTEGNEVATYKIENRSFKTVKVSSPIHSIAFSPDSQQFVTADVEGKVQAWNENTTSLINNLVEEQSSVLSMAAGPELLAVGLTDKITILDWNSGKTLPGIESPGNHSLVAFSPDGSMLASGKSSGQIDIWKYQNNAFTLAASLSKEQAVAMAFNAEGSLLAVGTASHVYLIDTASGEEVARIPHVDIVNGVSFTADGNTLATASSKAIQFWDITKIQKIEKDDLVRNACLHLTENFSEGKWKDLFLQEPYRILCENLPMSP